MRKNGARTRVYTVVDVLAGIAVGAYSYRRLKDAEACTARLREGRNLQEDDVRLFEGVLDAHPGRGQVAEVKEH